VRAFVRIFVDTIQRREPESRLASAPSAALYAVSQGFSLFQVLDTGDRCISSQCDCAESYACALLWR